MSEVPFEEVVIQTIIFGSNLVCCWNLMFEGAEDEISGIVISIPKEIVSN